MSFQFGGTPTTTTGVSNFGFGAQKPATTMVATTFGTGTPTLSFGTPAANTAAPTLTFGTAAPNTTAPTLTFGAPAPTTAATAAPTLSFGAPAATGVPNASSAPTFGFGTPAVMTTSAGTSFPLIGAATTAAPTATVAPTLNFGAGGGIGGTNLLGATTTTAAAMPNFSAGFGSTNTTTAAQTIGLGGGIGSFSFAKPTTTTSATSSAASLNFGTTTTTATAAPFNTGLSGGTTGVGIFGKPLTGSTSATTLGQQATTTAAPFVGLGGIDVGSAQPKPGDAKLDTIKVKETQVPDEIAKTVDALKNYIKEQKTICSDIGRTSTSKFTNVTSEITNLQWALQGIADSVEANYQQIKLLRSETSKAIQAVEMAQRTQETPTGLQFENNAPCQYFQCLVARYEQDLINFRQQIALTERHMQALANPQNISPEELKRGFKQINESFVSLAGRLHEIHQKVEEQKEHYLNLRRYRLRDPTNVFEKIDNPPDHSQFDPQRISSGPTPFSNINSLNKSYISSTNVTISSPSATGK